MVAASVILYQRVEKFSYILSCSKQDVYTFLFYFLRLSFSCSSHSLRLLGTQHQLTHPLLKNSSLPLRKILRVLHLGIQFSLYPVSSLFGIQQQLTQPPVKSSSFPLWKNHVSEGLFFC